MDALLEGGERIATSVSNWAKAPLTERMDLVQLSVTTIFIVSLAVFTATVFRRVTED